MKCGYCEKGSLVERFGENSVDYKGQVLLIQNYAFSVCDFCAHEIIAAHQLRHNRQLVADAKRAADGLLSSTEVSAIRTRLKLTQAMASTLIGGGENSFWKYESGEVIQSVAVDRLLRLASRQPDFVLGSLREFAGLPKLDVTRSETLADTFVWSTVARKAQGMGCVGDLVILKKGSGRSNHLTFDASMAV